VIKKFKEKEKLSQFEQNKIMILDKCAKLECELLSEFKSMSKSITVKCFHCETIKKYKGCYHFVAIEHKNLPCCSSYTNVHSDDMKKYFIERNFEMIGKYHGSGRELSVKCLTCNYVYTKNQAAGFTNFKCSRCLSSNSIKYTLEDVLSICDKYSFKFLDNKFINVTWYHNFECKNGHYAHKTFSKLVESLNAGTNSCRKCSYEEKKLTKDEVIERCLLHNINIIDKYNGHKVIQKLQCCKCNYKWEDTPYNIYTENRSTGCKNCRKVAHLKSENITKNILVEMFGINNINIHKCINEKVYYKKEIIRNKIYVDFQIILNNKCYIIEYNGKQHYEQRNYYKDMNKNNKIFNEQKARDRWLRKYCKNKNIVLVEIDGRKYTGNKIKTFLENYFN